MMDQEGPGGTRRDQEGLGGTNRDQEGPIGTMRNQKEASEHKRVNWL